LCEKKRARRYCPGVGGEICPTCCGAERENTIACPFECEYLQAAREHERPVELPLDQFPDHELPNKDIRITESFLRNQDHLVIWLSHSLVRAMESGQAVDFDAREALDAIIKTYRTLQSGLVYETKPQNPYAAAIQQKLNEAIEELRKSVAEEAGMQLLKDSDVLGVLVFLQRMEIQHNNGRKKGRAFLQFLRNYFPARLPEAGAEGAVELPGVVTPPGVIL
jgi:hypothetical protein